jgi:hypothetical protein
MRENIQKFGNADDALRAYNGGWDKNRWNNPETRNYVASIQGIRDGGKVAYKPFATVRKDIDPKTLNADPDWLTASKAMYQLRERKSFEGNEAELAEWGKNFMGNFNYNMVDMARYAHDLTKNGTQEDKEAFLWMMDTYDNTNISLEGVGRAVKGIATDPTTYVGLGTLGIGTAGKIAASTATKQGIKKLMMESLGRTGIIAGIEGGIYAGTDNAIRQNIQIDAGRKDEFSLGQLAANTGVGVIGGVVLGTGADMALSAISKRISGISTKGDTPTINAEGATSPPKATDIANPSELPKGSPEALPEVPKSTALTPEEIKAAMARQQEGRLPEDNVVPEITGTPKIDVPEAPTTGLRDTPTTQRDIIETAKVIPEQLRNLSKDDLVATLEQLRTGQYTGEQFKILSSGLQQYADEVMVEMASLTKRMNLEPNSPDYPQWQARMLELEDRHSAVLADDAFGSFAGSLLNLRRHGLQIDPNLKPGTDEFADAVNLAMKSKEAQEIASKWDSQIGKAIDEGNMEEVARLTTMKYKEMDTLADAHANGASSFMAKVNEFAISNVFSPTTVMINLVPSAAKTVMIPALRAIASNPLKKETRVAAAASYSAMKSSMGAAWRGAKAAFKYEQSMLTRDAGRLLEGELAIKGRKGELIRTLPRILNATDEFLGQINYQSYIAGKVAAEAYLEGAEAGLKGADLDKFVKDKIKVGIESSYKVDDGEGLIRPIVNKGVNLGLTGDDLIKYVEREAMRDPQALKHGSDEAALNFVRDVLYKRQFSQDNVASKFAKGYEDLVGKFPAAKFLSGQLFFRTPIRVFEEGVRLTPGLQFIAPKFLSDLKGLNGTDRQIRAQGEALMSLSIAAAVMTLYAEGKVSGDGAYDNYRQSKLREDSDLPPPYTLKFSDGSTWSFRNFDPLATPVKIMVNAFERMDKLAIREAQGEFINKEEWQHQMAGVSVALGSIASALKDANLLAGVKQWEEMGTMLGDPEKRGTDMFIKYVGDRLKMMVPNTLHKIAKDNDPRMTDPATFWQMVEARLSSNTVNFNDEIKTSYAYDILGKVREPSDTGTLWNIFSVATPEERTKGMSDESLAVLREMDRLSKETGAIFSFEPKHQMTGSLDLRTKMTSDGKETLYDRWMTHYKELQPDQVLYPIAISDMPTGTFGQKGVKAEMMMSTARQLRDAAFMRLLSEEQQVFDRMYNETVRKAESKGGLWDYSVRDK